MRRGRKGRLTLAVNNIKFSLRQNHKAEHPGLRPKYGCPFADNAAVKTSGGPSPSFSDPVLPHRASVPRGLTPCPPPVMLDSRPSEPRQPEVNRTAPAVRLSGERSEPDQGDAGPRPGDAGRIKPDCAPSFGGRTRAGRSGRPRPHRDLTLGLVGCADKLTGRRGRPVGLNLSLRGLTGVSEPARRQYVLGRPPRPAGHRDQATPCSDPAVRRG